MQSRLKLALLSLAFALSPPIVSAENARANSVKLDVDMSKPMTVEVLVNFQATQGDVSALNTTLLRNGFTPSVEVNEKNGHTSSKIIGRKTGLFTNSDLNAASNEITPLAEKAGGKVSWTFIQSKKSK